MRSLAACSSSYGDRRRVAAHGSISASVRQAAGFSGEDGGVESGEGFAGDGHGGLEGGGASLLQSAEAVDNLSCLDNILIDENLLKTLLDQEGVKRLEIVCMASAA